MLPLIREAKRVCAAPPLAGRSDGRRRGGYELLESRCMLSVTPGSIDLTLAPGTTFTATVAVDVPALEAGAPGGDTIVSLAPVGDTLGLTQAVTPVTGVAVPRDAAGSVTFEVAFSVPEGFTGGPAVFELQARGAANQTGSGGGFLDVLVVIDESISLEGEQAFIGGFIESLDARLRAAGFGLPTFGQTNQYGLVGFANDEPGENLGRVVPVNDARFGSAAEFAAATEQLTATGFTEDGYAAVDFALQEYEFRDGSQRIVILVTDEDRDVLAAGLDAQSFVAGIDEAGASLITIVDVSLESTGGETALAVDAEGDAYLERPGGAFELGAGLVRSSSEGTTIRDYVDPTLAAGGLVADLNQLRSGGNAAEAFSAALIDSILSTSQDSLLDLGVVRVTIDGSLVDTIPSLPGVTTEVPIEVELGPTEPPTEEQPLPAEPPEPTAIITQPIPTAPTPDAGSLGGSSSAPEQVLVQRRFSDPPNVLSAPRELDAAFGQGYEQIASIAIIEQQLDRRTDQALLLVVAETDVPETFTYDQGEETPLRRPAEGVVTQVALNLPPPDEPAVVVDAGDEPSGVSRLWWLALGALPPMSLWFVRRRRQMNAA